MDCPVKPGNDDLYKAVTLGRAVTPQNKAVTLGLDPRVHLADAQAMGGYVYILASDRNGTLYIGVTNDLVRRVFEHREEAAEGFTRRYGVKRLVHYEQFDDIRTAIQREKSLKRWSRAWKIELIEQANPEWDDLYPTIVA